MKSFRKTVFRTFKQNFAKMLAVTAIITLGICFVCGIGALSPKILDSFNEEIKTNQAADVIIKSTLQSGFSQNDIDRISTFNGVDKSIAVTAIDTPIDGKNSRAYLIDKDGFSINKLTLIEGSMPEVDQCVIDRASTLYSEIKIGDKIDFLSKSLTVCGIVSNPLFFVKEGEQDIIDQNPLEQIIYANIGTYSKFFPKTDIFVRVKSTADTNIFSSLYTTQISDFVLSIKGAEWYADDCEFLSLDENKSTVILKSLTDKIDVICLVFPVFFILVVALVVLTTMTRLIEEERSAIGCYKTLGYSDSRIASKYLALIFFCCNIGILLGNFAGVYVLPRVIYPAFSAIFFLPQISATINMQLGLICSAIMLATSMVVVSYVVLKELHSSPALLLKPKAPRAGRKIFLERLPFVWNRLSFKHKSTARNIFRYVGRFWMVVISVAGSTALVMAGFGLRDIAANGNEIDGVLRGMSDSLSMISYVVILFSAVLCVLVIYNLTNMNIGERKREIATLKVLGYHDGEVGGYIYREIFVMAVFGIAVGIPLGVAILGFVFYYLDFGALADIKWWSYLLAGLVNIVSIICVNLLLYPKIKKQDMNASLKTIE